MGVREGERGRGKRRGRDIKRAGGDGCDKVNNGEREYLEEGEGQSALTIVREG